jgi:hypothetical protein
MPENDQDRQSARSRADKFAEEAAGAPSSLLAEWVDFLLHNKKWWLAPILVALLVVAVLIIIGSSGAAPFLYTIF